MKINCNSKVLSDACLNVQRAVSVKSSMPTIEGILIKTVAQGVELSGYDLEVGINTIIDANIEEEGGIIINAKTLCDIVRHLPGDRVTVTADERNICNIVSGESKFSLIGIPAQEYPELPYVMGGIPIVLQQTMLRDMVKQTIFAVSVDDSRAVHRGIKFEITAGEIKLIAIDGYRLAIRREKIEYTGDDLTFIVPAKTLAEVIKFASDENGYISMGLGKRHIVFSINGYNVVSRLLEGDFLDYRNAVPKEFTSSVRVKTREMLESMDRMSLLIMEKIKSPLKCIMDDGMIKFSISTTLGSANDTVTAQTQGDRVEIGFNSRFLTDAFRACETDEAIVKLNGPVSPVCIIPVEGDSFLYLVLPVRLKNDN